MTTQYLEIDSTYRNRNLWPHPGQFDVFISPSGSKAPENAADPVSRAASRNRWQGYRFQQDTTANNITVSVDTSSGIGYTTDTNTLIVDTTEVGTSGAGSLQTRDNYYTRAVIENANGERRRILSYRYLGLDHAEIVHDGAAFPNLADNILLTILDPTELELGTFFVPDGRFGNNAYTGSILYNETQDEYRAITSFEENTHILTIDITKSGSVTAWSVDDIYSIRKETPSFCTQLDNPILTKSAFNFPPTVTRTNLEGSFLERYGPLSEQGALASVLSQTRVQLDATASTVNGFYNQCRLRLTSGAASGEIVTIVQYDGVAQVATVEPAFVGTPIAGDTYTIICESEARVISRYIDFRGSAVGGSTTEILFPRTASNVSGIYTNLFLRRTATNELTRITSYTVTQNSNTGFFTRTATIQPAFSTPISQGDAFTITSGLLKDPFSGNLAQNENVCILPFSYDNEYPFVYSGSIVSRQEMVCYEMSLISLTIPNTILDSGQGNRAAFYPYMYVEISNNMSGMRNVIYSNNPSASNMVFRAAVDDINNPKTTSFVRLTGNGMRQTIKFKINDNLRFSVRFPNGDIFRTLQMEDMSPQPPNALNQVSALFGLKML